MNTLESKIRSFFADVVGQDLPQGPQVNILCPLREETNPSFSLNVETGLWTCHGGCGQGNFAQLKERVTSGAQHQHKPNELHDTPEKGHSDQAAKRGEMITCFSYSDDHGTPLYRVVRTDRLNGTKTFSAEAMSPDGTYVPGIGGVRRVLYHLPEVSTANLVVIPEGELCVEVIRELNLSDIAGCRVAATCNFGGAGKWRDEYSPYLKRKRVILLPDNDDAGRQHMLSVARSTNPFASQIKLVELPNLRPKGDVYDFWVAHRDRAAAELLKLIEAAPIWTDFDERAHSVRILKPSDILAASSQKLEWLVEGLLLAGGLYLVGAKPKVGKSTFSRALGVAVARGDSFLGRATKQGAVMYIALEDSLQIIGDHIRKLGLTDADPLRFITEPLSTDALRIEVERQRPALVVIDPLYRFANIKRVDDYMENITALV